MVRVGKKNKKQNQNRARQKKIAKNIRARAKKKIIHHVGQKKIRARRKSPEHLALDNT